MYKMFQAFINEAETMLSGVSLTMTKIEPTHVTSTHTPSVIGTQEVYRSVINYQLFNLLINQFQGSSITNVDGAAREETERPQTDGRFKAELRGENETLCSRGMNKHF